MRAMTTHLDSEIWGGFPYEAERCTHVNLHDNVVGVVRHGVKHLVIREAGYSHHGLVHPLRAHPKHVPLLTM